MQGIDSILVVIGLIVLVVLIALWHGWIFVGPNGEILTGKDKPSFFRFYATLLRHPLKVLGWDAEWRKR
jgi:hypothetical protein